VASGMRDPNSDVHASIQDAAKGLSDLARETAQQTAQVMMCEHTRPVDVKVLAMVSAMMHHCHVGLFLMSRAESPARLEEWARSTKLEIAIKTQ